MRSPSLFSPVLKLAIISLNNKDMKNNNQDHFKHFKQPIK